MSVALTDTNKCKGCYYCVEQCPKQCISIGNETNSKGYQTIVVDTSLCIGCGICFTVCPDLVFTIND